MSEKTERVVYLDTSRVLRCTICGDEYFPLVGVSKPEPCANCYDGEEASV